MFIKLTNYFFLDIDKPSLVCTQHRFMYQSGDNFTMIFELNNTHAPAVKNAAAVVKYYTGKLTLNRYS